MLNVLPTVDQELDWRNPLIIGVDGLLSVAECEALIARIEASGPTAAPITIARGFELRPEIRNNTRVMCDDLALAAQYTKGHSAQVRRR